MIRFLIPEPQDRRSGGTLYDLTMVEALQEKGFDIKSDWVSAKGGIENLLTDLDKEDHLIIDGLVFHQNFNDAHLLQPYGKIYLSHLPFWLEPGISEEESNSRKIREVNFIKTFKAVICNSEFIKEELFKCGIKREKIIVINPRTSIGSRQKKTYEKNPSKLLAVGGVHFGKGLDILIKALEQSKNSKWKLKIAGYYNPNDDYFKGINNMIEKSGLSKKIKFLGECNADQIIELYLNSDLLLHPSRFESFGMAVGEAINLRLPVLSSDAGALPSVYNSTPVRFFKSEDVTSLAELLKSTLYPKRYQEWSKDFENHNFKKENKESFYRQLDNLITYLK